MSSFGRRAVARAPVPAFAVLAAALALAAPARAWADDGRLIGVLRIDASGVSDTAGQKFEQRPHSVHA